MDYDLQIKKFYKLASTILIPKRFFQFVFLIN